MMIICYCFSWCLYNVIVSCYNDNNDFNVSYYVDNDFTVSCDNDNNVTVSLDVFLYVYHDVIISCNNDNDGFNVSYDVNNNGFVSRADEDDDDNWGKDDDYKDYDDDVLMVKFTWYPLCSSPCTGRWWEGQRL